MAILAILEIGYRFQLWYRHRNFGNEIVADLLALATL